MSEINIVYCRVHKIHGEDGCPTCDQEIEESARYLSSCCEGTPVPETLEIDNWRGVKPKYEAYGKCSKCFENVDFYKEYPEYD